MQYSPGTMRLGGGGGGVAKGAITLISKICAFLLNFEFYCMIPYLEPTFEAFAICSPSNQNMVIVPVLVSFC